MNLEVEGSIVHIGQTELITDNFQKRDVVVETEGEYPQQILIQFVQDKCDILDKYAEGEEVTVSCNLRGRKWEKGERSGWMNTIQGWKIKSTGDKEATAKPSSSSTADTYTPPQVEDQGDDLPF